MTASLPTLAQRMPRLARLFPDLLGLRDDPELVAAVEGFTPEQLAEVEDAALEAAAEALAAIRATGRERS